MRRLLVIGLVLVAAGSIVVFGTLALSDDEQARSDEPAVLYEIESRIYSSSGETAWPCRRPPYKPCPSADISATTIYP